MGTYWCTGLFPSQEQGFALPSLMTFTRLLSAHLSCLLRSLWRAARPLAHQLCVIGKRAEGTLCPITQIVNEDVKQERSGVDPLLTPGVRLAPGRHRMCSDVSCSRSVGGGWDWPRLARGSPGLCPQSLPRQSRHWQRLDRDPRYTSTRGKGVWSGTGAWARTGSKTRQRVHSPWRSCGGAICQEACQGLSSGRGLHVGGSRLPLLAWGETASSRTLACFLL